ncbi:hypothetical protein CR513_34853, partial [Mucuna pruriens]
MRPSLRAKLTPLTKFARFLEIFMQLHINIPFMEAIAATPKYAKFLKEVISNKRKLGEFELMELNKECSTIELKMLPSSRN